MGGKEDAQQLAQTDLGRVIDQAYDLVVPGRAAADLLVAGLLHVTIAVAAFDVEHAAHAVEHGLRAPETATAKDSCKYLNLKDTLKDASTYTLSNSRK